MTYIAACLKPFERDYEGREHERTCEQCQRFMRGEYDADHPGALVATLTWEGGDLVERLSVVDGQITTEEIDI